MKKFILTLLGTLILGAISAFAESVKIDFTQSPIEITDGSNSSTVTKTDQQELGDVTLNDYLSLTSNGKWWTKKLRFYRNNTLEIVGEASVKITKIAVAYTYKAFVGNFKVKDGDATSYSNATNYTTSGTSGTYTWNAPNGSNIHSILFTNTGDQSRLNSITITYEEVNPGKPTITLAFEETEGTVNKGESKNLPAVSASGYDGTLPDLEYTSDNTKVATVKNGVVTGVAAGTATITASCVVEGYNVKDAEYTVTVVDPNALFVELTPQTFNYVTNSYGTASFTDPVTNVSYSAVYYGSNTFMQFNTDNKNGKGSGINVTVPSDNYLISSIAIEFDTPSAGLNVYAKDDAFSDLTKTGTPSTSGATKINNSAIKADQTIAINKKAFALLPAGSGAIKVKKVTVNYKKIDTSKTTPTLTFENKEVTAEYPEVKTLEVQVPTSDPAGLTFTYESSNTEVATIEGTTITLLGAGTTNITAKFAGDDANKLNPTSASYTLKVVAVANNVAELNSMCNTKDASALIKFPVTVTYVNGPNIYVKDATGDGMYIYQTNTYAVGDVIPAGWTATFAVYGQQEEFTMSETPAASGNEDVVYPTVTEISKADAYKVVILKNVVFDAAVPTETAKNFNGTFNGTEYTFRTKYTVDGTYPAGTYYVTGIVNIYNNALQIFPIAYSAQPTEAVSVTPEPDAKGEIKVKAGDIITFTIANAAKLKVEIVTDEPEPQGAPMLKATTERIVDGNTFEYTVPNEVVSTMITVTPINNEGEELTNLAKTVLLEDATQTGIIDVTVAGEGEVEYFNLQGVRVANPESGLYIRRQGNQVSKVYLR